MPASFYLLLATGLPLASFVLLIFFGKRFAGLAGPFATLLLLGSLGLSVTALMVWVGKPEFIQPHNVEALTYRWLPVPANVPAPSVLPTFELRSLGGAAGGAGADGGPAPGFAVGYCIDSLTVALFVLVTLIGSLVHVFSISAMAGDPRLPRYFAYLGLLTFAMLALLLSNSLLQLFAFWQIAGVAAALLVGFWFERRGPAMASLKMVLVNRIGDAAFLIGLGLLVYHVGPGGLTFYDSQGTSVLSDSVRHVLGVGSSEFLYYTGADAAAFLGLHWLTWAGLLLFAGAVAKASAFPLHVWLADSAEAPPPVAAMLQSATMIVAGVYLVARLYLVLTLDARLVIAIIGCVTLLLGALVALVQTDIRKLLAYSTISQVGYMLLFLGSGGYTAGLLHLFTHGFIKAGLLLAVGSVVLSLNQENDLRQMGGLWRRLPLTAVGFSIAALGLIGAPFFAGGYSLQFGLAGVYEYTQALSAAAQLRTPMLLFYIPAATAFLTAFYMARCGWLIFGGKSRNEELAEHAHESFLIVLPIGILAALSVNFYEFFGLRKLIARSLLPTLSGGPPVLPGYEHVESVLQMLVTRQGGYVAWAWLAAVPAVLIYWGGFGFAERIRRLPVVNLVYIWLREKMFFDSLYNGAVVGVILAASRIGAFIDRFVLDGVGRSVVLLTRALSRLCNSVDKRVVGGIVMLMAGAVGAGGKGVLVPHGGRVRISILAMLTGAALLGGLLALAIWRGV